MLQHCSTRKDLAIRQIGVAKGPTVIVNRYQKRHSILHKATNIANRSTSSTIKAKHRQNNEVFQRSQVSESKFVSSQTDQTTEIIQRETQYHGAHKNQKQISHTVIPII